MVSKIKALWGIPVFRWVTYQALVTWFVVLATMDDPYGKSSWVASFLALPAVWVWRKPILKHVRKLTSFLNKAAEED